MVWWYQVFRVTMLEPHLAWAGQTSATSQLAIVWVVQVVWSQLHAGSMKAALENM